jgi:hypothetical protein
MGKIIIDVKDKSKEYLLLDFLKELPFIEIKESSLDKKGYLEFRKLYGIWKDRDISKNDLRKKAWDRSTR